MKDLRYLKENVVPGNWRGVRGVKLIDRGAYSDPQLYFKDEDGTEYIANYWDVEDSMWQYFLDETGRKDSDSDNAEVEEMFNEFCQKNRDSVISDIMDMDENNVNESLQENVGLADVDTKDHGEVDQTYAAAIRDIKKAEKKKAEFTKRQAEPKHDEKPKNPKMVKGAKKMHLDESLFEDSDSSNFKRDYNENLTEARVGKTKEVAVLQGNYGYGWDDLVEYDIPKDYYEYKKVSAEIRQDLKDYRENEKNANHRVIHRRVPTTPNDYNPDITRTFQESIKNESTLQDFQVDLDKEVDSIRNFMTKSGMPPKKSREEHKKFLSKLKDKRKEIKESAEPDVAGFVQEIKQVLKPEDIDTHESDLYVRVSPETRRLLRKYNMLDNPMLSTFVDEIDHDRWYDIPFGNLGNQLSLTESKQLNEGAGAGYTVQGELYEIKINRIEDIDVYQGKSAFGTDLEFAKVKVDADAKFDGTVESYYYGAELEGAQVKITEFDINPNILHYLGLEEFNYGEITAEDLQSQFGSVLKFKSDVIGGGWIHTPFDGNVTASRVDDDYSPFVDGISFHFVNQADIDYAEQGLQGELDDDYSEDDYDLEESTSLKEMSRYGMQTQFDKRKSFYNKADVDVDDETGEKTLYSYNTPVAKITKDKKVTLLPKWDLSATTLRHVKEFLKQNGLVADSLKQIRRDYI